MPSYETSTHTDTQTHTDGNAILRDFNIFPKGQWKQNNWKNNQLNEDGEEEQPAQPKWKNNNNKVSPHTHTISTCTTHTPFSTLTLIPSLAEADLNPRRAIHSHQVNLDSL
eukprot:GHVR01082153.1.p1 GENE.GHVR01082153.1~~GHVR01082153.1.p1  ORF type:complete len:111 (+),score=29.55 GHVR01082153.1:133-465(+)